MLFTDEEITHLKFYAQPKFVPNNKIIEVANEFICKYVVREIDVIFDVRHQQQIKIDTYKQKMVKRLQKNSLNCSYTKIII